MVVGLTGGIGSGKSTVLSFFMELGTPVFIADTEAKELMKTNNNLKKSIISLFGDKAYVADELNREFIASIVFNKKEKLQELNNLVHPVVRLEFEKFKKKHDGEIIIYEAAILFESGNDKNCDYIITVTANEKEKIKRLVKRDLFTKSKIEARMRNQVNDEFRIKRSHFVIKNLDLRNTKEQVLTIFKMLSKLNKECNIS